MAPTEVSTSDYEIESEKMPTSQNNVAPFSPTSINKDKLYIIGYVSWLLGDWLDGYFIRSG
jgi:hypothetical protein